MAIPNRDQHTSARKQTRQGQTAAAPQTAISHPEQMGLNLSHPLISDHILQLQRQIGNQATNTIVQRASVNLLRTPPVTLPAATRHKPDIQRLPSKTEVETQVGKAGHYLFSKTSWAHILDGLDEYKTALENKNKANQLKAVIKLQKYTEEWFVSKERGKAGKKKKVNDGKKADFLNSIRPDLKILYYELKTKGKTVDVVAQNAADNAGENIQLIKQKLLQQNIGNSDQAIQKMLNRLKNAPLTYNFDSNVLQFLIKSPDFKTIWELTYKDNSPGGTLPALYDELTGSQKREAAERWLGYDPFGADQRVNRPAYVGVNVLGNPKGAAPS